MSEQTQIDNYEIDLLNLFSVLLGRRRIILGITLTVMLLIVFFLLLTIFLPPQISPLPNKYRPQALMLINDSSSSGGSVSSMLSSSGLGGLASLAGVSISGGSTYSALAVYLAGTNSFLDSVVDAFDLVNRYKIKKYPRAESRKALKKKLTASYDEDSGVFSIAFEDYDPVFAQKVVNFSVQYFEDRFREMGLDKNLLQKVNLETNIANTYEEIRKLETASQELERSVSLGRNSANIPSITLEAARIKREIAAQEQVYTQLKIQYELLKVQIASETPVFQVLEYAEAPDKKSGPSRGLICIAVSFAAFFGAIALVFVQDAIEKIRRDPDAMAKLKGEAR